MEIAYTVDLIDEDLTVMLKCPFCEHEQLASGNNDDNFKLVVIPAIYCGSCGKNEAGETK